MGVSKEELGCEETVRRACEFFILFFYYYISVPHVHTIYYIVIFH